MRSVMGYTSGVFGSGLALVLVVAPAPAQPAPAPPVVTGVSPLSASVGDVLEVRGRGFLPGAGRTTVVLRRDGGRAVFIAAEQATARRLRITLPAKLAAFLVEHRGVRRRTRFRVRVVAERSSIGYTRRGASPMIGPVRPPAPPATTPGTTAASVPTVPAPVAGSGAAPPGATAGCFAIPAGFDPATLLDPAVLQDPATLALLASLLGGSANVLAGGLPTFCPVA